MPEIRVAASYVRLLYEYLTLQGRDAETLLGPQPDPADHFVTMSRWQGMLACVDALEARPALSLRVAECISPRHFGVLGHAALACATLADALARMERFHASVYDANPARLWPQSEGVCIEWGVERGRPGALVDETAIASLVQLARDMTGRMVPVPLVAFVNPAPVDVQPYEDFFGGRVLFGQPSTRLVLSHAHLALPLRKADPDLLALLDQHAEVLLKQAASLPADVAHWRTSLLPLIREGRPSLKALAAAHHMSERTLQRHLSLAGLSFQGLLVRSRQHLAEAYLRDTRLDLAEIALLLGYSEQSAFQRAFKQWTGQTPRQWRISWLRRA
jgi:AraC-like DNA-binding protein